ncbi:MAG: hypothetical protein D6769_00135 [Methanobacteriota archaeon]|nr:MAG: hypothetical protein D6769_00135 [Euryarchaeota archaeon]
MEMKRIYIPGDVIDEPVAKSLAVREDKGKLYATVVGTVEGKSFIPFELAYIPVVGDAIVGIVYDKKPSVYFVDTNSSYTGLVIARDLRGAELDVGDVIFAKVKKVEEDSIVLGDIKILQNGKIMSVPSSKIPRIIGKGASMLNLIKDATKTVIYVGANGYVWIAGKDVGKSVKAINAIIEKAHLSGLTDEIKQMLESD